MKTWQSVIETGQVGVCRDAGEHSRSIELVEAKFKIRVKVHCVEHGTVTDCYNNLARFYMSIGEHS